MDASVIELIVKITLFVTVIAIFYWLRTSGSAARNLLAIERWFDAMDVRVEGQRWQGGRSEVLRDLGNGPMGLMGYRCDVVCMTRSGRFFRLWIEATLSQVNAWRLRPLSPAEAQSLLDLSTDAFDALRRPMGSTPSADVATHASLVSPASDAGAVSPMAMTVTSSP